MPLFQNTVVNKYLKTQNGQHIAEKWHIYQNHFLQPAIQNNIRNSKEEQYQEGFLRDLFVKILGYTLNPDSNFNLTTELKNIKDNKKADGGIIIDNKVLGVIELKGTNITDLSKIETQAFGYKNNQPKCVYVITSNFEKLRFYIDNAIEHIEFNLFQLSEKEFELLYLTLAYENLKNNIPKKLKEESVSQEEEITKQLYKDYSLFKRELFQNLTKLNPQFEALELFKKSQKLLDRFLFLFFAEDRNLLPPNSVRLILNDWKDLQERDVDIPLYDRFKKYFEYLNVGYKGKRYDVFPYNGGLFKQDDILVNIQIDDGLLYKHTLKLSEYDFISEVDVNILGHIFENSLNELEEVIAKLEGKKIDRSKTKRKKDGVFYTPKYITKYIVDNTVGKLCNEKKEALQLIEQDYTADKKRQKKTKKALIEKLRDYRNWLLSLTICDPACGSGAFLNEALNYLIAEHKYTDELETKLLGASIVFPNIEKSILENNLFGVDINEEAVEIAKLSLWLRTAQKGRKLNTLSNNIKCGNSLIDDPEIAGKKAFNWHKEFPQVFGEDMLEAFHIVLTTHNSRVSKRMHELNIKTGTAIELNPEEEITLTNIIAKVIQENDYKCISYNICKDHVHIILVCEKDELTHIVKTLKGKSSYLFQSNGFKIIGELFWSQKYFYADLDTWKIAELSNRVGYTFGDEYIDRAIQYIKTNRQKHNLPHSDTLQNIINGFVLPVEKAFQQNYKGGFDVVIGNPPYVKEYTNKNAFNGLHKHPCYQGKMDLWYFFGWLGLEIVKNETGLVSYIAPNNWITNAGASVFRNIILEYGKIVEFIDFGDFKIFENAGIQTMIYIMSKTKNNEKYTVEYAKIEDKFITHEDVKLFLQKQQDKKFTYFKSDIIKTDFFNNFILFIDKSIKDVLDTIEKQKDFVLDKNEVAQGIVPPQDFVNQKSKNILGEGFEVGDGIFNLSQKEYKSLNLSEKEKEIIKPFYTSNELAKYYGNPNNQFWVIYTISKFKNSNEIEDYPKLKAHLDKFKEVITSDNKPYGLHRAREERFFIGEKINSLRKCNEPTFTYTDFDCYISQSYYIIKTDKVNLKTLTTILNSSLIKFWLKFRGKMQGEIFQIDKEPLLNIPLKNIEDQQPFIEKADQMLFLYKALQCLVQKFQRTLQRKFEQLNKLPKKLQDWYLLSYPDFVKELNKKKIKFNLSEESKWEDFFLPEQQKVQNIKEQIDHTDKEIDRMVYGLYGLTDEEIAIVENTG